MTGRIKWRLRHSFCSDIHLQDLKLGGSIQKTTWQLCQEVVGEPPGEWEGKICKNLILLTSRVLQSKSANLQDLKLGGSIQKTTRQLCQEVVEKVSGKAETKLQCETACVLHLLTKTRLICKSERSVHYTRIYKIQGIWACRAPAVMHTL